MRLRDFRKGDNGGVIDFFEIFFAAGRLDRRAQTTEIKLPRIRMSIDGNSARSEINTSVSFAFEIFKAFRETEITFVIAESAKSC